MFSILSKPRTNQSSSLPAVVLENILQERRKNRDHRRQWLRQFWQETWDSFLKCEYEGPDHSLYCLEHVITCNDEKSIDQDLDIIVDPGEVFLIRHPPHRRLCDRHFDNKSIERHIGLSRFAQAVAVRTLLRPERYDALVRDCMVVLNEREIDWCCSHFCSSCRLGLKQTARIQVTPFPFHVRLESSCRSYQLIELSINPEDSMEKLERMLGQFRFSPGPSKDVDAALNRLNLDAYKYYQLGVESLPFSFHTEIYHQHEISLDQLRSFLYGYRQTCPLYDEIFKKKFPGNHPIRNLILAMDTLRLIEDFGLLWWKFWAEIHRLGICSHPLAIDPIQSNSIAFMSDKISTLQDLCQMLQERGVSEPKEFLNRLPIESLLTRTSRRNSLPSRLFSDNRTHPMN